MVVAELAGRRQGPSDRHRHVEALPAPLSRRAADVGPPARSDLDLSLRLVGRLVEEGARNSLSVPGFECHRHPSQLSDDVCGTCGRPFCEPCLFYLDGDEALPALQQLRPGGRRHPSGILHPPGGDPPSAASAPEGRRRERAPGAHARLPPRSSRSARVRRAGDRRPRARPVRLGRRPRRRLERHLRSLSGRARAHGVGAIRARGYGGALRAPPSQDGARPGL